jgi:hypothetical protein
LRLYVIVPGIFAVLALMLRLVAVQGARLDVYFCGLDNVLLARGRLTVVESVPVGAFFAADAGQSRIQLPTDAVELRATLDARNS